MHRSRLLGGLLALGLVSMGCEVATETDASSRPDAPASGVERRVAPDTSLPSVAPSSAPVVTQPAAASPPPAAADVDAPRLEPPQPPSELVFVSGSTTGALDGAALDEPFDVQLVVPGTPPDFVEWRVDGVTFRDDDLLSPYNLRYDGSPLPIGATFTSDQGLPGGFELVVGREHEITAVAVFGDTELSVSAQFVVEAPPVTPTTATTPPVDSTPPPPAPPTITTAPSSPTTTPPSTTTIESPPTTVADDSSSPEPGTAWELPVGWEQYRRVDVPVGGGTVRLDDGDRVVLVMPDVAVPRAVKVVGGRDVVVIGGEIEISSPASNNSDEMGLRFFDQTGTIYVEGVWMHGAYLSEGFVFNAPGADAILRNNRIDDIKGGQHGGLNHADLVQPWGGLASLRIDGLTGSSRYQGLMLKADYNGPLGPVFVRRVNIEMVEGPAEDGLWPDNGGRYSWWFDPGDKTGSVQLDSATVWVDTNSKYKGGDLSQTVWPHTSRTGSDELGRWIEFEAPSIAGRVRQGTPPGGDYVPLGSVGIGYTG